MTAWITTLIAIAGTLTGTLLGGHLQARTARAARRDTRADHRWDTLLGAVTDLAAAIDRHRAAMWHREHLALTDADPAAVRAARDASHITRGDITRPLAALTILAPQLAPSARCAVDAAYALRDAPDTATLCALREAARAASDQLLADAHSTLGGSR